MDSSLKISNDTMVDNQMDSTLLSDLVKFCGVFENVILHEVSYWEVNNSVITLRLISGYIKCFIHDFLYWYAFISAVWLFISSSYNFGNNGASIDIDVWYIKTVQPKKFFHQKISFIPRKWQPRRGWKGKTWGM